MNPQQLIQVEELANQAYTSTSVSERSVAEDALKIFSSSIDYNVQCRFILDNSRSPLAQTIAAQSLLKLVSTSWPLFNPTQRIEIKNYLLVYLANYGPTLAPFVLSSLLQTTARVTKYGWFEDNTFQEIVDNANKFLEATLQHSTIGLKILNELILEMNQSNQQCHLSLTQQRKVSIAFRDKLLLRIFNIALSTLKQIVSQTTVLDEKVQEQSLKLALNCLSFDFIGTTPDDSSEDLGIAQIPSSWRPLFEDSTTVSLFFTLYKQSVSHQFSTVAMECLVQLVSVRRSLFSNDDDRGKYLSSLLNGICDILRNSTGLQYQPNHHEFCRLLARVKTIYQLHQLILVDVYPEWISLVASFTINSIKSINWAPNSVHYLLALWSRLVSSMTYVRTTTPTLLDTYAPQIIEVYINERLKNAGNTDNDDSDTELISEESHLSEQLEALPYLGRCKYQITSSYIVSVFDPLASEFQSKISHPVTNELALTENRLSWLVYIIGALMGGRLSISSPEEHDLIDGELASRVFQLLKIHDERLTLVSHTFSGNSPPSSSAKLELALLHFIQQFRKVYIGDQAMSSSKVYKRLDEVLGLSNHHVVLNLILGKIATNLKYWAGFHVIVEKTLGLFHDLASGYSSGKFLVRHELTSQILGKILANHNSDHFPFLDKEDNFYQRTTYYSTLGRLLFMDENISRFDDFMLPFERVLNGLLNLPSVEAFKQDNIRKVIIGFFRDLRGLAASCSSRRAYNLLFDWIYPNYISIIHTVADCYYANPEVISPLLKFMSEFVHNKSGRVTFDSSSPNGILLFRETSKLLVTYGNRLLSFSPPAGRNLYQERYKGIWLCLQILTRSLCGTYVNFGVFALYNDMALSNALGMALKLSLNIPLQELLSFPKLSKAYFALLEVLCNSHTSIIVDLETPIFTQILLSIQEGLKTTDANNISQCCSALDHLVSFYYQSCRKDTQTSRAYAKHISENPELFPRLLDLVFRIILYEDTPAQWSLSRPLLSLMLVCQNYYNEFKNQILASIPLEKRERVQTIFGKLMDDVQESLELKNRDKFTQNLTLFKHEIKTCIAS